MKSLWGEPSDNNFILFELERIIPKGTIKFIDLEQIANKGMRGKGQARLTRVGNEIILNANYKLQRMSIHGQAVINLSLIPGETIIPTLKSLTLGPILVPEVFYRKLANPKIYLTPTRGWPLFTEINSIEINEAYLKIN